VWLLVLVDLVAGLPAVRLLASACLVGFLFSAMPRASMHIRLLLLAATAAVGWRGLAAGDWAPARSGLESGIILGAFFPTLLLLRATANESPLIASARARVDRWSELQRAAWVQSIAHVLGSFLMIGGYLLARSALPGDLAEAQRVRMAEAAVRGLSLSVCWSPFFLASAIASQLVPTVGVSQLVLFGLLVAALGWGLSFLFYFRGLAAAEFAAAIRGAAVFAVPSALLVMLVIAVSHATGLKSLPAIVVSVPAVCLAYLAFLGWPRARRAIVQVPASLGRLSDELIVFTSATCIGAVVAGSDAGRGLSQLLGALAGTPLLLIGAEVGVIVGAGLAGIHPMITATLMIPVMVEAHRILADLVVAYIVVFGWALSSFMAIWTLPVVSAASTFDVPVRSLALGRNPRFVLAFGICGCAFLALANHVLLN
jgi:hypothetical protein